MLRTDGSTNRKNSSYEKQKIRERKSQCPKKLKEKLEVLFLLNRQMFFLASKGFSLAMFEMESIFIHFNWKYNGGGTVKWFCYDVFGKRVNCFTSIEGNDFWSAAVLALEIVCDRYGYEFITAVKADVSEHDKRIQATGLIRKKVTN